MERTGATSCGPGAPRPSLEHASLGCGHTFSSITSHRTPGDKVPRRQGLREEGSAYSPPWRVMLLQKHQQHPLQELPPLSRNLGRVQVLKS